MLFYTTTGEFGDSSFSIVAQEMYLLDIGNSTYTDYKPKEDIKLVPFLMANPTLVSMTKGHIHSHNTMGK